MRNLSGNGLGLWPPKKTSVAQLRRIGRYLARYNIQATDPDVWFLLFCAFEGELQSLIPKRHKRRSGAPNKRRRDFDLVKKVDEIQAQQNLDDVKRAIEILKRKDGRYKKTATRTLQNVYGNLKKHGHLGLPPRVKAAKPDPEN